jgi:hypothetical protein
MSLMSADERLLDAKRGIVVSGGVVTIDPYRGKPSLVVWAKLLLSGVWRSYFAAERMERDIVIHDETRQRELYRQGPYNGITVTQPLERLLSEIRSSGFGRIPAHTQGGGLPSWTTRRTQPSGSLGASVAVPASRQEGPDLGVWGIPVRPGGGHLGASKD